MRWWPPQRSGILSEHTSGKKQKLCLSCMTRQARPCTKRHSRGTSRTSASQGRKKGKSLPRLSMSERNPSATGFRIAERRAKKPRQRRTSWRPRRRPEQMIRTVESSASFVTRQARCSTTRRSARTTRETPSPRSTRERCLRTCSAWTRAPCASGSRTGGSAKGSRRPRTTASARRASGRCRTPRRAVRRARRGRPSSIPISPRRRSRRWVSSRVECSCTSGRVCLRLPLPRCSRRRRQVVQQQHHRR
mmetsp:Transcript_23339/g.50346  ORF Transcript_23339/g.50346 Transcript_23339/m.50346 type:complete len:248 (+) Transcript_23339:258-1001(+)